MGLELERSANGLMQVVDRGPGDFSELCSPNTKIFNPNKLCLGKLRGPLSEIRRQYREEGYTLLEEHHVLPGGYARVIDRWAQLRAEADFRNRRKEHTYTIEDEIPTSVYTGYNPRPEATYPSAAPLVKVFNDDHVTDSLRFFTDLSTPIEVDQISINSYGGGGRHANHGLERHQDNWDGDAEFTLIREPYNRGKPVLRIFPLGGRKAVTPEIPPGNWVLLRGDVWHEVMKVDQPRISWTVSYQRQGSRELSRP